MRAKAFSQSLSEEKPQKLCSFDFFSFFALPFPFYLALAFTLEIVWVLVEE